MKTVVVRNLLIDGDVIILKRHPWKPWRGWEEIGRFSARRNQIEYDMVTLKLKFQELAHDLAEENGRLKANINEAKAALGNDNGWTDEYEITVEDLEKYKKRVHRPNPDEWQSIFKPNFLKASGVLAGNPAKGSGKKQDSDGRASIDKANTVVHLQNGTDQATANALAKKVGAGSVEILKESYDKKDSNKQHNQQGKKKNKQQKWTNQRQGESDEDYQARMAEGPPNN